MLTSKVTESVLRLKMSSKNPPYNMVVMGCTTKNILRSFHHLIQLIKDYVYSHLLVTAKRERF